MKEKPRLQVVEDILNRRGKKDRKYRPPIGELNMRRGLERKPQPEVDVWPRKALRWKGLSMFIAERKTEEKGRVEERGHWGAGWWSDVLKETGKKSFHTHCTRHWKSTEWTEHAQLEGYIGTNKIEKTNKIESYPETNKWRLYLPFLSSCCSFFFFFFKECLWELLFCSIKMKINFVAEFNWSFSSTVQIMDLYLGLLNVAEK